jgi:hypothetical protein
MLARAAGQKGPRCAEAQALRQLRRLRRMDRQFFAFQVGEYLMVGPMPDAKTELDMIEAAEDDGVE